MRSALRCGSSLRHLAKLTERIDERLFRTLYSRSLVYNTCWEDPAVDRRALGLTGEDIVLVITSAGCNALDYALLAPRRIHAVDANPRQMLRPGGTMGVVDFYVSSVQPAPGRIRHPAWERWLWRRWFAHDGVRLDSGHMAQLAADMPDCRTFERRGKVPYLPGLTAPYYIFIGRKR
jgi:hypothetical protein